MGILKPFFSKKTRQPIETARRIDLAFVLLSQPALPSADSIISSYSEFAPADCEIAEASRDPQQPAINEVLSFQLDSKETAFVGFVPAPIPNAEADEGAKFSVCSLASGWKLPEHVAHLIVTMPSADSHPIIVQLSRFTSFLAAVAKSSESVGIYWGNAGATHGADFFLSVASSPGVVPRIMLWSGISIARERDGRLSLLSLGMQQLNIPDLLLVVSEPSEDSSIETFYDLLGYVAERGEPLPDGDTVGRTANERLPVHYVKSPVDNEKMVWRVELP